MLEPVYRNLVLLVYKEDTYRGQEEDEWPLKRIISHEEVDDEM